MVLISARAVSGVGNSILLGDRSITVNRKTYEEIAFDWTPDQAGEWEVQVNAIARDKTDQQVLAKTEYREIIQISSPPESSFAEVISAYGLVNPFAILLLIGGAFLLSGLVIFYILGSD